MPSLSRKQRLLQQSASAVVSLHRRRAYAKLLNYYSVLMYNIYMYLLNLCSLRAHNGLIL